MDNAQKDERFAHVAKDPRFHRMAREYRKVKIDKRFKGMMKDSQFKLKYSVDPRGRPVNITSNENLRRFYDLSSEEEDDEDLPKKEKTAKGKAKEKKADHVKSKGQQKEKQSSDESDVDLEEEKEIEKAEEEDEEKSDANVRSDDAQESGEKESDEEDGSESSEEDDSESDEPIDYARGQGAVESSTDDEFSDEQSEADEFEHDWGELDKAAIRGVDATHRLAVCNMDWDRIKAVDLLVLLSSFLPTGGVLNSVTIYTSDYGRERMAEEDLMGPREFRENPTKLKKSSDKDADDEKSHYHREKLREYQLNRLRYYYAVADFDSVETADHVYQQCNGVEYESSATQIDLRFIPDDMTFDQEPHSVASDLPDASMFKPSKFLTDALQQSKVHLTWDETDRDRVAVTMKKFSKDDLEAMDVKDYLASDSDDDGSLDPYAGIEEPDFGQTAENNGADSNDDDEEDNEEKQIEKYRALLQGLKEAEEEKDEEDKDMEITWEPGLKEATEEIISSKEEKKSLTPWESYLEKKKMKKFKKADDEDRNSDAPQELAFSDDELPDDVKESVMDESSAAPSKKGDKTKKKKKTEKVVAPEGESKESGELSLLLMDEKEKAEQGLKHFNLAAIQEAEELQKKKRKRKKLIAKGQKVPEVDNFKVDVQDSRFQELFENPLFNIDPSAPEYKKTQAMEALVEEKVKRRRLNKFKPAQSKTAEAPKEEKNTDTSLSSLVKSVKLKTKSLQEKRKRKPLLNK